MTGLKRDPAPKSSHKPPAGVSTAEASSIDDAVLGKGQEVPVSVLAIDLGASSGRGIVGTYSPSEGLTLTEVHRFENGPMRDAFAAADADVSVTVGGAAPTLRWDLDALLENIRVAAAKAVERFPSLASMGIDTWGVDYGLLDAGGTLIAPPAHYRDPRTQGLSAQLAAEGRLEGVYVATGIQVMDINTLFQLIAALRANPALATQAHRLLMMPDLLTYLLTGEGGCEASIASTTQLLRAGADTWDAELAERFGIPVSWLPRVTGEGEPRGRLVLGGGAEIPVVSVCEHDTASAVAAVGLDDRTLFASCGTWSLVGTVLDAPVVTPEAERLNITNERGAEGATLHLENCTGLWIAQELRRELIEAGERLSWDEVVAAAKTAPAFACVIDTDAPELAAPGSMPGKLQNLALQSGQPVPETTGELFRCVYESLALRYLRARDDIRRTTGRRFDSVRVIGGGAQNGFLCQLVADVLGVSVVAGPMEATAIGNVLVQLVAQGVFSNLSEARDAVRSSLSLVPYEPATPVPAEVLARYQQVCNRPTKA